jgi:hypothetical protein
MGRYTNLERIQELDPIRDHIEICQLMAAHEFHWDVSRALETAMLRTFCAPSISRLLHQTGEFRERPQKRYDDTDLIMATILKWGYDSDRGTAALQRLNQIHGHFAIANEDFLYVLSTFIYEPIRWLDRFGWRPLTTQERLASFYFWQAVGQRMQIQQIPATYEEFEQFNQQYEAQHFRYASTNRDVAQATENLFLSWFPAWLAPVIRPAIHALLDDKMLTAFGWQRPPQIWQTAIATGLKLRGRLLRYLPPRKQGKFQVDVPHRSYPQGYQLEDLGPPHLLKSLNRCPFKQMRDALK